MRLRFLVFPLILSLLIPQVVLPQSQVVSPQELQQALTSATKARQKNLDAVRSFFSSEPARKALDSGKIDHQRVQAAVATLTPDELSRLSARVHEIQRDFAAGALTNQELTYIIIALVTAVVILVVVAAD